MTVVANGRDNGVAMGGASLRERRRVARSGRFRCRCIV